MKLARSLSLPGKPDTCRRADTVRIGQCERSRYRKIVESMNG